MLYTNHENFSQGSVVNRCYIASFYDGLEDEKLKHICDQAVTTAHHRDIEGVIFSFVNVTVMDTFIFKMFLDASRVIKLLGARVIWTGLQPSVVSALIDFNLSIDEIETSMDVDEGISMIHMKRES